MDIFTKEKIWNFISILVYAILIVFVLYVFVPYGELIVYFLAISGVATFIQQMSGLLSLSINRKEMEINTEQ